MSVANATFSCDQCGKRYPWKPEYAGRKVKCKCGAVLTAPAHPPAAAQARPKPADSGMNLDALAGLAGGEPTGDNAYDVSAGEAPAKPQRRGAQAPAVAMAGAGAGAAVARPGAAMPLAYQRVPMRGAPPEKGTGDPTTSVTKDLYLPIGLIAVGVILSFIEASMELGGFNFVVSTAYVAINTIINLVLIFVALMVMVKLFGIGLGPIGTAVLKIAAVAILPAAIGGMITHIGAGAGYLAWVVTVLFYWWLMYMLFDMDFQEVSICTTIIWLIRTWVGMLIFMALFQMMFSGALPGGRGGSAAGPGFGRPGRTGAGFASRTGGGSSISDDDDDEDVGTVASKRAKGAMSPLAKNTGQPAAASEDNPDAKPSDEPKPEGEKTEGEKAVAMADGAKPDGAKPDEAKGDEAKPDESKPDGPKAADQSGGPSDDLRAPVDIPPVGAKAAAATSAPTTAPAAPESTPAPAPAPAATPDAPAPPAG